MSSEVRVFISAISSLPGSGFSATSKLGFLWFDRIFVEDLGRRSVLNAVIGNDTISQKDRIFVEDIIIPVSSIDGGDITRKAREFDFEGYPRWEANGKIFYKFSAPETPQQCAHNALLTHYEKKWA